LRAIFITLLVANMALFGWYQYQSTQNPSADDLTESVKGVSLGNLVLATQSQEATVVVSIPAPEVTVAVCMQLGGFDTQSDATQVQARLSALDIVASISIRKKQVVKDYWVYIAPYPTFQDAKNQLAELNLKGIDSFIFTEGDLKNGLSLGVYSKRENASAIFKKIEDLGYTPHITESFQDLNTFYVILNAEGTSFFNEGIMEPIKLRYPQVESQKIDC